MKLKQTAALTSHSATVVVSGGRLASRICPIEGAIRQSESAPTGNLVCAATGIDMHQRESGSATQSSSAASKSMIPSRAELEVSAALQLNSSSSFKRFSQPNAVRSSIQRENLGRDDSVEISEMLSSLEEEFGDIHHHYHSLLSSVNAKKKTSSARNQSRRIVAAAMSQE